MKIQANRKNRTYSTKEERWQALVTNDSRADGHFVYGVKTTGIFCIASCKSRRPRRENVQFFDTPELAIKAGFRGCKKCKPLKPRGEGNLQKIVSACRIIEKSEQEIKLDDLAKEVGLSSYHFHRLFKKTIGVTPKQYFKMEQLKKLQKSIAGEESVTEAIYSCGFSSSSSFYVKVKKELGMTPSHYKKGGAGIEISYAFAKSVFGLVLIAATENGVCAIELGEEKQRLLSQLKNRFPKAIVKMGDPSFSGLVKEVLAAIKNHRNNHSIPLDIQGTAFQKRVWQALLEIRPGSTMTYSQLAAKIGSPKSVRAVANACGANKIALLIPCHRVVGKNGKLSGYRWGVERKRKILEKEEG